jgi:hypothetical protein
MPPQRRLNTTISGLLTLMFMFVMVSIMCGSGFDVSLLLVPVATLFAITQLRASMPGAPPGFGGHILSASMFSFSQLYIPGAIVGKCNVRLLSSVSSNVV